MYYKPLLEKLTRIDFTCRSEETPYLCGQRVAGKGSKTKVVKQELAPKQRSASQAEQVETMLILTKTRGKKNSRAKRSGADKTSPNTTLATTLYICIELAVH